MERRAQAFGCFAVPAAVLELLAQELTGQCIVRFFEIRADGENSTVDAGLRFAVKERPVVKPLKHQPLVDAVDHFARFFAGGVEAEVHQGDETVEGNKQAPVLLRQIVSPPARARAPVSGRGLIGEKLCSPAFRCNARPLGCNRFGGFTGKVPHHLPTDGGVRIEEPLEVRGPGCALRCAMACRVTAPPTLTVAGVTLRDKRLSVVDEGLEHPAKRMKKALTSTEHTRGIRGMRIHLPRQRPEFRSIEAWGRGQRAQAVVRVVRHVVPPANIFCYLLWCYLRAPRVVLQ